MDFSTDLKKEEKKERLFFAFWPDNHLQLLLSQLVDKLFPKIKARAIPQDFLHVTVLFLGWTRPSIIEEIKAELPFWLKPEGFPLSLEFNKAVLKKRGKEGIIWFEAPLVPSPIEELLQVLTHFLTQKNVSFQAYDQFIPHITIFRHVSYKSIPESLAKQKMDLPSPFELTVDTLYLVQSELRPEGSSYKKIWACKLSSNKS
ncbi:RNA 2',3'-cyclic phosphodiesterase [Methylacidiphilum caldifontis]|uniref:RNA 2',3'-cyclic phosphodiesterase n=1 Tax=Methylacidiphilum caldifontis TaxID=2795386 RepID=UPI001A8E487E|nr:RNA 2',3'-cyclic phosphodiesterase [Methylacidiphilum caldifontis]QSR87933.1 RNA 2',3'-cyclic phosphodiesterase [Methylacidiphilum caldifontis]